ncbi:hypothetical protein DYB28_007296 [Aphanomyces astaci]|uniref:HTH CENPB-type domain-containing protein n=1 Tax=Aphanomyces astaci TaxID=112090 RepID=A0A9X8DV22_APHAT|nr:hypothetical protein DYB28_007296 [Aphanomyces astaci]
MRRHFTPFDMENTRVQTVRLKPRGRQRIKPEHPKPPKKFRNTLTSYKMKWAVIKSFDSVGMAETLTRLFPHHTDGRLGSTGKKVYQWTQNRVLIRDKESNPKISAHMCARSPGMATTLPKASEEQLVKWFRSIRTEGVPVTPRMIQVMALQMAIDAGIEERAFTASWSWFQGFKRRFRMTLRAHTRIGQDTQGDGDKALATFAARVAQVVRDNNIDVVYNADQTAVNYEYLPTKTLNAKGEHTIWVKCSGKTKDRATEMVMVDSMGKKYSLFLVMKTKASKVKAMVLENLTQRHGFGKTLWKEIKPLQEKFRCRIYGNPTAWWNSEISVDFLRFHFAARPDRQDKKVLLLWDTFSAHFTEEVTVCAAELNVLLEKIPPRFTWACQPADVAWIRPMKAHLRQMWIDSIRRQVLRHKSQTETFQLQAPKRPTLLRRNTGAWSGLADSIVLNGFAKCKIGAEVEVVSEPSEEVISSDMLSDLVARCAIEDTIDPLDDLDINSDDE